MIISSGFPMIKKRQLTHIEREVELKKLLAIYSICTELVYNTLHTIQIDILIQDNIP